MHHTAVMVRKVLFDGVEAEHERAESLVDRRGGSSGFGIVRQKTSCVGQE
jgi:hypothetical protein